jgi:hypothetical protein
MAERFGVGKELQISLSFNSINVWSIRMSITYTEELSAMRFKDTVTSLVVLILLSYNF